MNSEQPRKTTNQIDIEVCEDDLRRMAEEWKKYLDPSTDYHSDAPNLLRQAVEAKWRTYIALTNDTPNPEVEKRVRSIAMVNLS